MRNPGPSQADLPSSRAATSRGGWKAYALFLGVLTLVNYGYCGATDYQPVLVVDVALTVLGLSGVFGFAYRRPLLNRRFWVAWAVVMPLWDLLVNLRLYPANPPDAAAALSSMTLLLPAYVALWRYAHGSPDIWEPAGEPTKTAS